MGDDSNAHGGQLGENDRKSRDAQRALHTAGSIQLLFCKCDGDSQRRDLYRRCEDHGHHDKDTGITVFQ